MDTAELLILLKNDLQLMTTANDNYLTLLLGQAAVAIQQEGIILGTDQQSAGVQVQYAAWLFRKRASDNTAMPRFLRWQLNNMLMVQKGQVTADDNV